MADFALTAALAKKLGGGGGGGGGGVEDVKVNGTSIVTGGVANVVVNSDRGAVFNSSSGLSVNPADDGDIKTQAQQYKPITPLKQHRAAFYGLAKAAGDSTQSASSNEVGKYTDEAKNAIQNMLGLGVKKYATTEVTEDAAASGQLLFEDTEIGLYDELVICVYNKNGGDNPCLTGDFAYLSIRDVINNTYLSLSGSMYPGKSNPTIYRFKRLPGSLIGTCIAGTKQPITKSAVRTANYVDRVRWIVLNAGSGQTIKAGTVIEAYIGRF